MSQRLRNYVAVIISAAFAGILTASPAWAAGLDEARRGFGIGKTLGLICCLVVVGLVAIGALIGVMVSRRRGQK